MIDKIWYKRKANLLSLLLKPISNIFSKIAAVRKIQQIQTQYKSKIPIIIVGNISVGGTGKTPVVKKIAEIYLKQGKKPVIISRGYGVKSSKNTLEVKDNVLPSQCGDEPVMLYDALNGRVPIVVGRQRIASVQYIEKTYSNADIIICDDGLQHYKLARDYEIVVIDLYRMFGNNLCLPAGPLREPIERLKLVDCIIAIGECEDEDKSLLLSYNQNVLFTKTIATEFVNISSGERLFIKKFYDRPIVAVAGIGNPDKFFTTLEDNGLNIVGKKVFKDHYNFSLQDFSNIDSSQILVMTHKDAVKCKGFAKNNWWYLNIDISLHNVFFEDCLSLLN